MVRKNYHSPTALTIPYDSRFIAVTFTLLTLLAPQAALATELPFIQEPAFVNVDQATVSFGVSGCVQVLSTYDPDQDPAPIKQNIPTDGPTPGLSGFTVKLYRTDESGKPTTLVQQGTTEWSETGEGCGVNFYFVVDGTSDPRPVTERVHYFIRYYAPPTGKLFYEHQLDITLTNRADTSANNRVAAHFNDSVGAWEQRYDTSREDGYTMGLVRMDTGHGGGPERLVYPVAPPEVYYIPPSDYGKYADIIAKADAENAAALRARGVVPAAVGANNVPLPTETAATTATTKTTAAADKKVPTSYAISDKWDLVLQIAVIATATVVLWQLGQKWLRQKLN